MADPATEQRIRADYLASGPTRATSREIVQRIASDNGLSIASVRSILVKAGIYIALPKDKSKIEDADRAALLKRFADYDGPGQEEYFGPDSLMEALSNEFGYGKWAIGSYYREWNALGQPKSELEFHEASAGAAAKWRQRILGEPVDLGPTLGTSGKAKSRKGPDGCGWALIIGLSLLLVTCISSFDPDEGKSDLQRKADVLCGEMGGCR